MKAATRPDVQIAPDDDVSLLIDPRHVRWLDAQTGDAIGPPPEVSAANIPA
ncbi:MAG TPA: hypothetical protein VNW68_07375 [Candidatus Limnocylindria bacterium]|nr:hypothetical protein [Candidatus Limnocylindria bacterium]